MRPNRRYRLRCTTDGCTFSNYIVGPTVTARSSLIWVIFRAHCDLKHRGTRPLTAMVASVTDPGDYAELIL